MDRSIASDEWLYAQYLAAFRKMLLAHDMEVIGRAFDQVINELEIIANAPDMNKVSGFMEKDSFSIDQAKEDIRIASEFLLNKRIVLLKTLQK